MKVSITSVVLFAICIIVLISFSTSAREITVSPEKNSIYDYVVDKNGNGDFLSIQEAVSRVPQGSSILIKSGTYPEIVEIKKEIRLVGEEKESTLINPISKENRYAVYLGAPKVSLSGLTIYNGAPGLYSSGIKITADRTEIYDCKIIDTPVGIAVWSSENRIENCTFIGCKDEGIALLGSKNSPCNDNAILNCVFYENCDGIELQYSQKNTISNCEIYDNTHTGIDAIASKNDENVISDCNIYNNRVHGIYLSASSENKIIDCLFSNNKDGDIIENRYSKNNQVISNDDVEDENSVLNKQLSFFARIFERSSIVKDGRLLGMIKELAF